MTSYRITLLVGAVLFGIAGSAQAAGDITIVRDLASRVGPVIGSAQACRDIGASPHPVHCRQIFAGDPGSLVERGGAFRPHPDLRSHRGRRTRRRDLGQDRLHPGRPSACRSRTLDLRTEPLQRHRPVACRRCDRRQCGTAPTAPVPTGPLPRGIGEKEIRFGIAAPFSGSARELGRQMKLGIETAFNRINDAGGVDGRMLKLFAADDGYEPGRTLDAMKQLYEKDQVFGVIGNVGTPTAAVAIPYALERRMLFFGAFTGSNILRNDPPDRYVFNYRASYVQETDAVVRYLVKIRRLQPRQIAVFAQQDSYGDSGFAGVAKAFRTMGVNDSAILRLNYARNTVDVDDAVNQLKLQKTPIKAIVMVATYRAAARFIEKTREAFPGLIYSNVSFVGSTALAEELKLLGPRYTNGVIVTQVVPAVSGYSSAVLEYKNALAKYFPGEAADYVSFEGYVAANVMIAGIKRAGPQVDTERLIDTLETMRNLDLGLGTQLSFGRSEHQASNKVWGTALDESGRYQPLELE